MTKSLLSLSHQLSLARTISRRHRLILWIGAVVTLASLILVSRLRLDSDVVALLPKNSPSVLELRHLTDKLGGTGDMQVMIRSEDPEQSIAYAEHLLPQIQGLNWVQNASMGYPRPFFDQRKLLYMDLPDLEVVEKRVDARVEFETIAAQPFYVDLEDLPPPSLDFSDIEAKYENGDTPREYFSNPSGTILLILVQPTGVASDLSRAQDIQADMEHLVSASAPQAFHPSMQVEVGGAYRNRIDEYKAILRDVRSSSVVVALLILLLISLYFRHFLAMLVVVVPLLMSLSWTFAITVLLIGSLNLVSVFLIVVLMGLGIDFGIHMLARYQEERTKGMALVPALGLTLGKAGRASLTAAFTTAACFMGLLTTDFKGLFEFGFIASTGLMTSALAYFTMMPALLALLAKHGKMPFRPRRKGRAKSWRRGAWPARLVLALSLILVLGSVYLGRRAQFEYDLRELRASLPETREFNARVREVFPEARDPAAIVVSDAAEVPAVVEELEERKRMTEPDSPIENVLSIYDFLPEDQDRKLAILSGLREEVDRLFEILHEEERADFASIRKDLDAPAVSISSLPKSVSRRFLGRPEVPGQVLYVYQSGSLLDLRVASRFSEVLSDLRIGDDEYHAISEPLIYVAMLDMLSRDAPRILFLAGAGLFLLLILDFRSLRALVLVLLPLATGLALMIGCMAIIPIRLNFLNAIVLPAMLGLGVDGGVHMYHAFEEHGVAALARILRETGGAVLVCTLSSLIAFGGLLTSGHPGLRSIGLLALVGLTGCLFGALVVLPALLASIGRGASGRV